MTPLAFLDTETTSLDPDTGEIWEVGLILRDQDGADRYRWLLPVTLEHADPESLDVGRFHDRHPQGDRWPDGADPDDPHIVGDLPLWCEAFAVLTDGAHLVGNVVSFDEERLRRLLHRHGIQHAWAYHLIDVENLAAGYLCGHAEYVTAGSDFRAIATPPWDSEELSIAVGVTPPGPDQRHTALGDALWARDIYDAVMGGA